MCRIVRILIYEISESEATNKNNSINPFMLEMLERLGFEWENSSYFGISIYSLFRSQQPPISCLWWYINPQNHEFNLDFSRIKNAQRNKTQLKNGLPHCQCYAIRRGCARLNQNVIYMTCI